nr:MAG TPA: hypothetical protein [Caudoviricetes sp.]DAO18535.1 MAG TPA: hypothetical protein [Caudoviricetes sp.]
MAHNQRQSGSSPLPAPMKLNCKGGSRIQRWKKNFIKI